MTGFLGSMTGLWGSMSRLLGSSAWPAMARMSRSSSVLRLQLSSSLAKVSCMMILTSPSSASSRAVASPSVAAFLTGSPGTSVIASSSWTAALSLVSSHNSSTASTTS